MNISAEAESYSLSDPLTVPKTGTHLPQGCVKERLLRDSCGSEWTPEPYEDIDLGQYLFWRSRNVRPSGNRRPAWLYRSYPAGELEL
jgi:hypothetical protein